VVDHSSPEARPSAPRQSKAWLRQLPGPGLALWSTSPKGEVRRNRGRHPPGTFNPGGRGVGVVGREVEATGVGFQPGRWGQGSRGRRADLLGAQRLPGLRRTSGAGGASTSEDSLKATRAADTRRRAGLPGRYDSSSRTRARTISAPITRTSSGDGRPGAAPGCAIGGRAQSQVSRSGAAYRFTRRGSPSSAGRGR
jgi:hypothetical protein